MPEANDKLNPPPLRKGYIFTGFKFPTTTPIPDVVFDELAHVLTGAEYKVLLYICRRTFGFKKESDDISISQMVDGIVRRDGTRLDYGCGVKSNRTVISAIKSLVELGIIEATRNYSEQKGFEATTFQLKFTGNSEILSPELAEPVQTNPSAEITQGGASAKTTQAPSAENTQALVQKLHIQETDIQKTDQQHVVVALLSKYGLSRNSAQKFANTHDEAYLEQKVAYLAYNLAYAPENVKKPAAWLRRAIEQDWAAPDGYRTPEQIADEKAQLSTAQQRQQQADQIKQQQQAEQQAEKEREWEAARHLSRTHFGTSEAEITLWEQVLIDLKPQLAFNIYPLLENGELLAIQEKTAVIGVLFPLHQGIVADKARHQLVSSFSYLNQDVDDIKVVVLGDVDSTPANGTQSSLVVATVASSDNSD